MANDDTRPILKTFDEAITVLGGTSSAARRLGRTPVQVCQWRVRHGTIPAELFPIAVAEFAKEGYRAPWKLFRFERVKRRAG